jgi:hypothetical protein
MGSWRPPREDLAGPRKQAYRGPPMTRANMRHHGVRSLDVTCELCHHRAVLNVDAWSDDVPVPSFGPRMVCTCCGIIGADTRPNWQERLAQATMLGWQWRRVDLAQNWHASGGYMEVPST